MPFEKGKKHIFYGQPRSEEIKEKIRKTVIEKYRLGLNNPKQGFQKGNQIHFGRQLTTEHRKKISLWLKTHRPPKFEITDRDGYVLIYSPYHPFCNHQGRVRRSRLIMERHLQRFLLPSEIVHHINEIKNDDRIENLAHFNSNSAHTKHHHQKRNRNKFGQYL